MKLNLKAYVSKSIAPLIVARVAMGIYLYVPYVIPYGRSVGLSLPSLLAVEAGFTALIVVFDVPLGYFADRIGPRQALLISCLAEAAAAAIMGVFPSLLSYLVAQPLFAAATAIAGGADSALTESLLRREGAENRFEGVEESFYRAVLVVGCVGLVASTPLARVSVNLTFTASALIQLVAFVILLYVPDERGSSNRQPDHKRLAFQLRLIGESLVENGSRARLVVITMVLTGTSFSVLLYILPAIYLAHGAEAANLGLLSAAVQLGSALLAWFGRSRFGLLPLLVVAGLATVSLNVPYLWVAVFAAVIIQAVQALTMPLYKVKALALFRDTGKALTLSIVTTSRNLGFALLTPLMGWLFSFVGVAGLGVTCALLFGSGAFLSIDRSRSDVD